MQLQSKLMDVCKTNRNHLADKIWSLELLSLWHLFLLWSASFCFFSVGFFLLSQSSLFPSTDWVPDTDWWDTHGARRPANQQTNPPTNLSRRSHFPLVPPFISPTAAPNWMIASQCFSGVRLPASCYQPLTLTLQHPWVDLWPCL